MPDQLKEVLTERAHRSPSKQPFDPKLAVEQSLMRLNETFPESLKVNTVSASPYMDLLGAYAAVHPWAPKTIMYHRDIAADPDLADSTLAHELQHVRQGTQMPFMDRMLAPLKTIMTPRKRHLEELDAEATSDMLMQNRKDDIYLPTERNVMMRPIKPYQR